MENKNSTNSLSIVGFVLSFIFSIAGLVVSIIALCQIKKTNEGGKGFAIAGIIISALKMAAIIVIAILGFVFSSLVWSGIKDEIIDETKCSRAYSCTDYCDAFDDDCKETCSYCVDDDCSEIGSVMCSPY